MHIRPGGRRGRADRRDAGAGPAALQARIGHQGCPILVDAGANLGAEMDRSRIGGCVTLRTTNSTGSFEIVFSRMKENAVELEFSEKFTWSPPTVTVAVDFWADEAVERYWISNVSACVCAR